MILERFYFLIFIYVDVGACVYTCVQVHLDARGGHQMALEQQVLSDVWIGFSGRSSLSY